MRKNVSVEQINQHEFVVSVFQTDATIEVIYVDQLLPSNVKKVLFQIAQNTRCIIISEQVVPENIEYACHTTMRCDRNTQVTYLVVGSIAGTNNQQLTVDMHGQGAHMTIRCLYGVYGDGIVSVTSAQNHRAADTTSHLLVKKLVTDSGRAVHEGDVFIANDAPGSDASQMSKTLLLSDEARAYARPCLQALHNDVSCAHGSAIGQLDQEQLLYLQSRGIAEGDAQKLLVQGFANNMFTDYETLITPQVIDNIVNVVCRTEIT